MEETTGIAQFLGEAKMFVASEGFAVTGGAVTVFGTPDREVIAPDLGAVALDASFNTGGDVVAVGFDSVDFTARTSGSVAILESELLDLAIPVGVAGLDIAFTDWVTELYFDTEVPGVFIGPQQVTDTATPLTFA